MATITTIKIYDCVVCKERFGDLFEHLTGRETGMLNIVDEAHDAYLNVVEHSKKGRTYAKPCFCGGTIVSSGTSHYGSISWEDSCTSCGFLYDED